MTLYSILVLTTNMQVKVHNVVLYRRTHTTSVSILWCPYSVSILRCPYSVSILWCPYRLLHHLYHPTSVSILWCAYRLLHHLYYCTTCITLPPVSPYQCQHTVMSIQITAPPESAYQFSSSLGGSRGLLIESCKWKSWMLRCNSIVSNWDLSSVSHLGIQYTQCYSLLAQQN